MPARYRFQRSSDAKSYSLLAGTVSPALILIRNTKTLAILPESCFGSHVGPQMPHASVCWTHESASKAGSCARFLKIQQGVQCSYIVLVFNARVRSPYKLVCGSGLQ